MRFENVVALCLSSHTLKETTSGGPLSFNVHGTFQIVSHKLVCGC